MEKVPEYHYVTPQEWYESLDDRTRKIADQKIAILKQFNADDPLGWVASEMRENIPQVARFLFLHRIRSEVLNGHLHFTLPENADFEKSLPPLKRLEVGGDAYRRLIASGANQEDLVRVARAATCSAVLNLVEMLDGVSYSDVDTIDNAPNWSIMETIEENDEWKLTGRTLDGLHESIFGLYPEDD
jgi:hypothetical protein